MHFRMMERPTYAIREHAEVDEPPNGTMNDTEPCTLLEWDTTFFKLPNRTCAGDTLTAHDVRWVDTWCSQNKIDCLYFLARSDQPSVLQSRSDERI